LSSVTDASELIEELRELEVTDVLSSEVLGLIEIIFL
jgi:hypothetical protein